MTHRRHTSQDEHVQRQRRSRVRLVGLSLAALSLVVVSLPATGQSWWPFGQTESRPPVPREPVYRPPAQPGPGPVPQAGPSAGYGQKSSICVQLEQRLVAEGQRGSQGQQLLPKLEADIRQLERQIQSGGAQLDRNDCFEFWLFSKSLKRTRQCVDLNNQVEDAKRRLADASAQRQQILGSQGRSHQDEIVRELARNNCGAAYQQEAAKRSNPFSSIWQDEGESIGGGGGQFGNLPFATYRTVCVRLCDGYYFPVSFSTLPNHFQRDADLCQSKCAAPVELYYHQNPGAGMDQALSMKAQEPYSKLKTAFRYRKEFVQGCSCKQAEYLPSGAGQPADKRAEAPAAMPPAVRR